MTFKQQATAAIEAMMLPQENCQWLEFTLTDQHNQTLRDVLARIADIPEEPTIDKLLEEIIDPTGENRMFTVQIYPEDEEFPAQFEVRALTDFQITSSGKNHFGISEKSFAAAVRMLREKL